MEKNHILNLLPLNTNSLQIYFLILIIHFTIIPDVFNQTLSAENIYKKVNDAVVVIYAYDDEGRLSSQGSGVVISDKGYVVTNYHILAGNDRLEILHNTEVVPYVDIIGIDVEKDILILKIDEKRFPAIKIGDSAKLKIGQRIYAIGSPLGFENSLSEGIISGLRSYDETGKNFIQITASISSGSSGGAVVNDKGELIGISTFTAKDGQNLNFAIPINEIFSINIDSYSKNKRYKNSELFRKAMLAFDNGNYLEAIMYYTDYIKRNPENASAYVNRGYAWSLVGDHEGAVEDYNRAIKIKPYFAGAYVNRGVSKSYLLDYEGAIEDFNNVIEINPNFPNIYYNRANQKANLRDYKSAIRDYNKAIEVNPNLIAAYYNRGNMKYNLGDKFGACSDWSKAGELGYYKAYELIREICN